MPNEKNIASLTTAQRMAALLNTYYAKKTDLTQISTDSANAIKSATYANNTLSLFRTADSSGTAAFTFNLPEELFLDQANTAFVGDFAFSSQTYPGAADPNLDGKPVLVLAVKGDDTSVTYSFLNMETLTDTYSSAAGDGSATVTVNGYTIGVNVNVSATAGNLLSKEQDGSLYVDGSGKADKVSGAVGGNLAGLNASGNLTDSGVAAADVVTKIASPTASNLVMQNVSGMIADSGIAASAVLLASDMVDYTEAELRTLLGLPAATA